MVSCAGISSFPSSARRAGHGVLLAEGRTDILEDVLLFGEVEKGVVTMQAAKAAAAVASHLCLREELVVVVDPDRAVTQGPGNTQAARTVARPHAGGKAEDS